MSPTPPLEPAVLNFNILQLIALLLLTLTLIPAIFSKSVHRMKTWFLLLCSFVVYCISYLLLLGHQGQQQEPSRALCIIQAGLVYAGPPFVAAAGLTFVIELHLKMSSIIEGNLPDHERLVNRMLFVPPLTHLTVFGTIHIISLNDVQKVRRNDYGIYCSFNGRFPWRFASIIVTVFLVSTLLVEFYTIARLFARRAVIRSMKQSNTASLLWLLIRTLVFTVIVGLSIVIMHILVNLSGNDQLENQLKNLIAIVPLTTIIVFGTQLDILQFYLFWRRQPPPLEGDSTSDLQDKTTVQSIELCIVAREDSCSV